MQTRYEKLLNSMKEKAQLIKYNPGMTLRNSSNGAVDPSSLGYQYTIQTTTLIRAKVIDQKFYEFPWTQYVPTAVGEGAYMEDIKTNLVFASASDFESGVQSTGQEARIQTVSAGISPLSYKIFTWTGGYQYSIMELEKALRSTNWNPVESKQKTLKKLWDLGIQKVAYLGAIKDQTGVPGLLSNAGVNVDSGTITSNISAMDATSYATLIASLLAAYWANTNKTVMPTHFMMPMSDFLGMGTLVPGTVGTYPVSKLKYLLESFKEITMNPNFVIYGTAYGDAAVNAGYWAMNGTDRYCLYRKDPDTLLMDLPLDFTMLAPNTDNNFNWNGVAYGQFTGMQIFRVPEVFYFDHT